MKFNGLIGGTYTLPNVSVEAQLTFNMNPEPMPDKGYWSRGRSGIATFATIGDGGVRAAFASNGRSWWVVGGQFYEVFADGTFALRGLIADGSNVQIESNAFNLMITVGSVGAIYSYDLSTNVLAPVLIPFFSGPNSLAMIDGYFIIGLRGSRQIAIAGPYSTTFNALDIASAEGTADNIARVFAVDRELRVFTGGTMQPYYNSGNPDFPWLPIQGTLRNVGLKAPASLASINDTLFWLGTEGGDQGAGVVYKCRGYEPQPISNFAVAWAMQQYGTIDDAVGYCMERNSHYFYVLSFPAANATWVYDLTTDMWTQWGSWNDESAPAQFISWYGRFHCYAFGKHLVGDWTQGRIGELSDTVYQDFDKPIRVLRRSPNIRSGSKRIRYSSLRLGMGVGVGTSTGQGANPKMMMRYSDDGGHTWSNEMQAAVGPIGAFNQTVEWHRLGSTRYEQGRVFEISATDPVQQSWFTADLEAN
jgi:hypothetical protein